MSLLLDIKVNNTLILVILYPSSYSLEILGIRVYNCFIISILN